MSENPFGNRSEDEVLASTCGFQRYRGRTWNEVVDMDPSYVIWLGENGKLAADEAFLVELAYEAEGDDENEDYREYYY